MANMSKIRRVDLAREPCFLGVRIPGSDAPLGFLSEEGSLLISLHEQGLGTKRCEDTGPNSQISDGRHIAMNTIGMR